ncbi:MAG: photosynthetic reaction center cytochrome c subunit [Blastochloris sp.]|nr:photosynthetic reaction center cytochrome c subunit [Blastochloris sp.]
MIKERQVSMPFGQRTAFLLVFGIVSAVFALGSLGTVAWINAQLRGFEPAPPATAADYVNYSILGSDGQTADYIRPESLAAMTAYTEANPEPQGVQILEGMTTAEISVYMVSQMSGGLKVDCTYCHILTNGNFAEEGNPQKDRARQMMLMSADLNQNFLTQLPASVGNQQITCATCHNGQPVFNPYPDEVQVTQPADFRLPLDLEYPGGLTVTGRSDRSLEDVALNQYTMYHMNRSLGQGCTFCHNARYFPSNEIEQKGHATIMLQMTKHLNDQYLTIMNNRTPSCWQCHQGARIPPAAAREGRVPTVLSSTP